MAEAAPKPDVNAVAVEPKEEEKFHRERSQRRQNRSNFPPSLGASVFAFVPKRGGSAPVPSLAKEIEEAKQEAKEANDLAREAKRLATQALEAMQNMKEQFWKQFGSPTRSETSRTMENEVSSDSTGEGLHLKLTARVEQTEKDVREQLRLFSDEIQGHSKKFNDSLESLTTQTLEAKQQNESIKQQVGSFIEETKNQMMKQDETCSTLEASLQTVREECGLIERRVASATEQKIVESLESASATTNAQVQAVETKFEEKRQSIESRVDALASHVSTRTEFAETSVKQAGRHALAEMESRLKKYDDSLEHMKRQIATAAATSEAAQRDVKQQIQAGKADAMHQVEELTQQIQTRIDAIEKSMQIRINAVEKLVNRHGDSWALEKQQMMSEQARIADKKLVQMEKNINAALDQKLNHADRRTEQRLSEAGKHVADMTDSVHRVHCEFGQDLTRLQTELTQATQSQRDLETISAQAIADMRAKLNVLSRSLESKVSDQQLDTTVDHINEHFRTVHSALDKKASNQYFEATFQGLQESMSRSINARNADVALLKTEVSSAKDQVKLMEMRANQDEMAYKKQLETSLTSMRKECESFEAEAKAMKQQLAEVQHVAQLKFAEWEAKATSLQQNVDRSASLSHLELAIENVRTEITKSGGTLRSEMNNLGQGMKQELSNLKGTCEKNDADKATIMQLIDNITQKVNANVPKKLLETTMTHVVWEKVVPELNTLKERIRILSEHINHAGAMLQDKASKGEVDKMIAQHEKEMVDFHKALRTKVSDCDMIGLRGMVSDERFKMQASVLTIENKLKTYENAGFDLIRKNQNLEQVVTDFKETMLEIQQSLAKQISITMNFQHQVDKIPSLEESFKELARRCRQFVFAKVEGLRDNMKAYLQLFDEDVQSKISEISSTHVSRLQNDVGEVRTQVAELEDGVMQRVSSLDTDIVQHQARIDRIDGAVNVLETLTAEALGMEQEQ